MIIRTVTINGRVRVVGKRRPEAPWKTNSKLMEKSWAAEGFHPELAQRWCKRHGHTYDRHIDASAQTDASRIVA